TGADYDLAIRLANIAGGLEVEKIGVATVTRDEILRDLLRTNQGQGPQIGKLLPVNILRHELESRRRLGQRVAFTNGCFDVPHSAKDTRRRGYYRTLMLLESSPWSVVSSE